MTRSRKGRSHCNSVATDRGRSPGRPPRGLALPTGPTWPCEVGVEDAHSIPISLKAFIEDSGPCDESLSIVALETNNCAALHHRPNKVENQQKPENRKNSIECSPLSPLYPRAQNKKKTDQKEGSPSASAANPMLVPHSNPSDQSYSCGVPAPVSPSTDHPGSF